MEMTYSRSLSKSETGSRLNICILKCVLLCHTVLLLNNRSEDTVEGN